jgi:hypothetical protein
MFIPNHIAVLHRLNELNLYAEPIFSPSIRVECAVVKLIVDARKTSVRADSSASRGTAEERVLVGKILFLPNSSPQIGDKVEIQNQILRCNAVHPRIDVAGRLDHNECDFEVWFDEN